MTSAAPPICVACKRPVEVYPALYDVHGQMHLLCFHLAYEHDGEPDAPCNDPGCPQWRIGQAEHALARHGAGDEISYSHDLLLALLRDTLGGMRLFAYPYDADRFPSALLHAEALLAVLSGTTTLSDYLASGRHAYQQRGATAHFGHLSYYWYELERLHKGGLPGAALAPLTIAGTLFLKLLLLAMQRIRHLVDEGQTSGIADEVKHIHNVPGHMRREDVELLRYYLEAERTSYSQVVGPQSAQRFQQIWRALEVETRRLARAEVVSALSSNVKRGLYVLHAPKPVYVLLWLLYKLLSALIHVLGKGYRALAGAAARGDGHV